MNQLDRLGRPGRRAEQVLVHLASLATVRDSGKNSELNHALQMATRAQRAGADDEVVLAALLHDIGKVFGDAGHELISAAVLEPHVRPDVAAVVRHHVAFTARYWSPDIEPDPREQFADEPWFDLARTFVDEWDMQSFDPGYDAYELEHFEPLVRRLVIEP